MEIKVGVDKRTELMGVLFLISDYGNLNPRLVKVCHNEEYREKVFNHFGALREEKAIKLFNQICNELNFNFDAPIALILQLDKNFKFDELLPYPFIDRLNSSDLVIDFLNELPHFVEVSNFEEFYNSNTQFYNKIIKKTEKSINFDGINKFFDEFYKMEIPTNFVINLMPHSTRGNYGVSPKGEVWCNLSIKDVDGEMSFVWDNVGDLFVHEFSHSIVNPLVEKYVKLPKNYFKKIYPQMAKLAYAENDITIFDEFIIRAIEYIYVKFYYKDKLKGKTPSEIAENIINSYKEEGFIYIDILTRLLENYYLNKDKYSNFEAFMPTLIKEFKKEKTLMDKNALNTLKA